MTQTGPGVKETIAEASPLMREGIRLIESKAYKRAEELFSKAVEREPGDILRHYYLGRSLLLQNRVDEAEQCFEKILYIDLNSYLGLYGGAQIDAARKQWESAIAKYRSLIAMQPQNLASVYQDFGSVLSRIWRWQDAIDCYRKLVQLEPQNPLYRQYLADTLYRGYRYLGAVEEYQKLVSLKPNDFWSYHQLGKSCFKVDRFEDAAASFEKAFSIDSTQFDAYEAAAMSFESIAQQEQSKKYWQGAIERKGQSGLRSAVKEAEEKVSERKTTLFNKREIVKTASIEANKLTQENELLLLQLQQVQEELKAYFLKTQEQGKIIEQQGLVIETYNELEQSRAELAEKM